MSKAEKLKGMRPITLEAVKAQAATDKLLPTRDAYKDKPGYWEKPKPGGGYTWGYKFKTNEGGKLTKEGGEMIEAMTPYAQASTARVAAQNGFPGDYGKSLMGRVMLMPRAIAGDWCGGCDRLKTWCECSGDAEAEGDSRTDAGKDATRTRGATCR